MPRLPAKRNTWILPTNPELAIVMNNHSFDYDNVKAVSSRDGSRSVFILPPLAVILVGMLMGFLFLGPAGLTASAQGSGIDEVQVTTTTLDSSSDISLDQASLGQQPGSISAIFTPEVQYWEESIVLWSSNAGLDPNLAATVMQIESCGNPQAVSRAGAIGLFQVMPFHFLEGEDPYSPEINALRGLDYLRRSFEKAEGDIRLALAGYNGGIGVIGQPESAWAGETIRYAYWGSGIYTDAASGGSESLHLQEWINANGLYLCKHAAERLQINP